MVTNFSISNTISQLEEDAKNLRRAIVDERTRGNSSWVLTANNSTVSVNADGTPTVKAALYCDRFTREAAISALLFVASRCGAILQSRKLQDVFVERLEQNQHALRTLLALHDADKKD